MEGSEDSPPLVVCDAGPLIHLDQLGCVELLADFQQVLVPETVWEEVSRHRPAALKEGTVRFTKARAPESLSAELEALSRLLALHRGEQGGTANLAVLGGNLPPSPGRTSHLTGGSWATRARRPSGW